MNDPSHTHPSQQNIPSQSEELLAQLLTNVLDTPPAEQIDKLEEVCQQHPSIAGELRELWGTAMVANTAGTSSHSNEIAQRLSPDARQNELDDYELLEELGRGGMGVVYRARQRSLNREVALKMIVRGQFASPEEHRRFQREARSTASLNHPNIVSVYDIGEINGQPYFTMQYVRGRTLAERMHAGPMASREIAKLVAIIARAVHAAHTCGVLHRDLKPSNILIDELGQPHVTDFGLAKELSEAGSMTRTGAVVGTPAYMSPEQATGGRTPVGQTSDVYSIGAILYFLLTNRTPFAGDSPIDIMMKVREQDVTPPRAFQPNVDRKLEMIALRCLQKPTDLRYESAEFLALDLEAYLRDEPISAASGRFSDIVSQLFRETHHAIVLENWGVLWMWHSLVLFVACTLTNVLHLQNFRERWYYMALWTAGVGTWAAVFWALRRRVWAGDVRGTPDRTCLGRKYGVDRGTILRRNDLGLARSQPVPGARPDYRHGFHGQSGHSFGGLLRPNTRLIYHRARHGILAPIRAFDFWRGCRRLLLLSRIEVLSATQKCR